MDASKSKQNYSWQPRSCKNLADFFETVAEIAGLSEAGGLKGLEVAARTFALVFSALAKLWPIAMKYSSRLTQASRLRSNTNELQNQERPEEDGHTLPTSKPKTKSPEKERL